MSVHTNQPGTDLNTLTGTVPYGTVIVNSSGVVVQLTNGASGKVLTSNGASALPTWEVPSLSAAMITSGLLAVARGGTGVDSSSAANGSLLIGNGTGLALATLTAGTGIAVTNGSGTITVNSNFLGNFAVGSLPAGAAGNLAYATNGRKNGEGGGSGTGVLVFKDSSAWIAVDTGATVAA